MVRTLPVKAKVSWKRLATTSKQIPIHAWWSLPFIVAEIALVSYGFSTFRGPLAPLTYAEPLRPFLIGASLTVAVFAVNFSFIGIQLSPYRGALARI
jgi:hypothetical protein